MLIDVASYFWSVEQELIKFVPYYFLIHISFLAVDVAIYFAFAFLLFLLDILFLIISYSWFIPCRLLKS